MYSQNFVSDFNALSELLKDNETDVAPPPVSAAFRSAAANPASIGPDQLLDVQVPKPKGRLRNKEIWAEHEVTDPVTDDTDDPREQPEYEFIYRQAVQSADAFLGMSGKDPSSTCCEDMVIRIKLPKMKSAAGADLDVKATYLKLSSTLYKLSVFLPHKVDHQKAKARFDVATKVLDITVPIIRELDM